MGRKGKKTQKTAKTRSSSGAEAGQGRMPGQQPIPGTSRSSQPQNVVGGVPPSKHIRAMQECSGVSHAPPGLGAGPSQVPAGVNEETSRLPHSNPKPLSCFRGGRRFYRRPIGEGVFRDPDDLLRPIFPPGWPQRSSDSEEESNDPGQSSSTESSVASADSPAELPSSPCTPASPVPIPGVIPLGEIPKPLPTPTYLPAPPPPNSFPYSTVSISPALPVPSHHTPLIFPNNPSPALPVSFHQTPQNFPPNPPPALPIPSQHTTLIFPPNPPPALRIPFRHTSQMVPQNPPPARQIPFQHTPLISPPNPPPATQIRPTTIPSLLSLKIDRPPELIPSPGPSASGTQPQFDPTALGKDKPGCWNCGGDGHNWANCSTPRRKFCRNCGRAGATRATCPQCKDWWRQNACLRQ